MNRAQVKRQKVKLFEVQQGKCYWCNVLMILSFYPPDHRPMNPRRATIEHLDDKFSSDRGRWPHGECRRVLACWGCNNKRGAHSQAVQPIEVLRERSGRKGSE